MVPVHYSTMLRGYANRYEEGTTVGVFGGSGPPEFKGGQSSGGVMALTFEQLAAINGWTNDVWGWGGEDGDLDMRIKAVYGEFNSPAEIIQYSGFRACTFVHLQDQESDQKGAIGVSKPQPRRTDASGLREIGAFYTHIKTVYGSLYTMITIDPLHPAPDY